MPAAGRLGGPGLPGRVRIGEATMTSDAFMERDQWGRFMKEAERGGDRLMEMLADKLEDRTQFYAPVRTGRLKRSLRSILLNGNRELRLTTDVPYAVVMEAGSRPHYIHGVRANFKMNNGRRFVWNDHRFGPIDPAHPSANYQNWTPEHGATVRHPGTKAHFYMKRGFRDTMAEARVVMRRAYS